jgi:hypothetical protein
VSAGEDERAGDKEEQERHGERANSPLEQGLLTVQVRLLLVEAREGIMGGISGRGESV